MLRYVRNRLQLPHQKTFDLFCPGIWRATIRVSISISVTKGRWGKMWAFWWMKWVIWLHRTVKRSWYWTPLLQFSLSVMAFRNYRSQRPGWKVGARKMYVPLMEEDQIREYLRKLNICMALMGCWGSWQMWLWSHSPKSLPDHDSGRNAWRLEEGKRHSDFQKERKGEPGDLRASETYHDPWVSGGTANPGNHFQTHEGKQNNWE